VQMGYRQKSKSAPGAGIEAVVNWVQVMGNGEGCVSSLHLTGALQQVKGLAIVGTALYSPTDGEPGTESVGASSSESPGATSARNGGSDRVRHFLTAV